MDLRAVGYGPPQTPDPGFYAKFGSSICFPSNNLLLATFITRERVGTLASRERPEHNLPLRLHGIFLDTATGKTEATREWPTPTLETGVASAPEGKFLVRTGDRITLYSPKIEPLKDLTLPPGHQQERMEGWNDHISPSGKVMSNSAAEHPTSLPWNGHISPTGKFMLLDRPLYNQNKYKGNEYKWIDSETLETIRSWSEDYWPVIGISDHDLAVREGGKKSQDRIFIRKLDGPWRVFCHKCGSPQFVNNQQLVVFKNGMALARTDSEVLFRQEFRSHEGVYQFRAAANGQRFAVAIAAWKGGSDLLDISPHPVLRRLMVYDIPSHQWIYSVDSKTAKIKRLPFRPNYFELFDIALSPDGSLLGILSDGIVQLYRVPETPTQPASRR